MRLAFNRFTMTTWAQMVWAMRAV